MTRSSTIISFDLGMLKQFENPISVYNLQKKLEVPHSTCWVATRRLLELGLIEQVEGPQRKNLFLKKKYFQQSRNGKVIIQGFQDYLSNVETGEK